MATTSTKTRAPVKGLNKDAATIAANAKTEAARKRASKKALKDATKPTTEAPAKAPTFIETTTDQQYRSNIDAAVIEADATGMSFEQACESMGIDPTTGAPVAPVKTKYTGPMLALRDRVAAKAYVTASNGNPCCADDLAAACGIHKPVDVVRGLIIALKLEGNPYLHLNIGQQSMNLRNKARGALKNGLLTMAEVLTALEQFEVVGA